jgi:hypothetical protein
VLGLPLLSPHLLSQDSLHPSQELQASVEVESLEVGALFHLGESLLIPVEHLHDLLGEGLADGEDFAGAALQVTRWRPGHTWCSRRSHRRT